MNALGKVQRYRCECGWVLQWCIGLPEDAERCLSRVKYEIDRHRDTCTLPGTLTNKD